MKIKTYQSESVTKALAQIKGDLGEDAVILNTKRTRKRKLLGLVPTVIYEITAASEPVGRDSMGAPRNGSGRAPRPQETYEVSEAPPRPNGAPPRPKGPGASAGDPARLELRLDRLSQGVEGMRRLLFRQGALSSSHLALAFSNQRRKGQTMDWSIAEAAAQELSRLVSEGLDERLARSLTSYAVDKITPGASPLQPALRALVRQAIERMVTTAPLIGDSRRLAVFLGPTGVGKTTTIAKLAAAMALKEARKVQLITLDTYRIAAAEQLKTYADIIGVPVRVVSSLEELAQAIERAENRDRVLIDTSGHSHRNLQGLENLAAFLGPRDGIEKHLVLSATAKPQDLREAIENFGIFSPDRLDFTKLDETSTFGAIASETILTGIPISYFTNGQAVPDDLQAATPKSVAELVVPQEP